VNLIATLTILFGAAAAVDLPKYPCFRITSPPKIDGRLDDAA